MDTDDYIMASHMAGQWILSALIDTLRTKGLLGDQDIHELYENALLSMEERQSEDPDLADIYEAARATIESVLRRNRE